MGDISTSPSIPIAETVSEGNQPPAFCVAPNFIDNIAFREAVRVVELLIMFVSIFINLIIIAVICFNIRLHTVPNVFIASLAVSDLISSFAYWITEYISFGRLCLLPERFKCIIAFINSFLYCADVSNHFLISVERWLYIARPFLHQRIVTRQSTVCSLVLAWVLPAIININLTTNDCMLVSVAASVNVGVVSPVLHFLLSLSLICIYTHIAYLTRRAIRNINITMPVVMSSEVHLVNRLGNSLRPALKNIRMLITVFGFYFVLSTPGICADMYAYSTDQLFYLKPVGTILDIFWFSHCSLNFFIYSVQDRAFRNVLKKWLSMFWRCASQSWQNTVHSTPDAL